MAQTKTAKKKFPTIIYKNIIILVVTLGILITLAKLYSSNSELKKENQAIKTYLYETTGLASDITSIHPELNRKVTEQNKHYQNKFLKISYDLPVGWYFDKQLFTSAIFLDNSSRGFMAIRNKLRSDTSSSLDYLQQGDYEIQLTAGLRKIDVNTEKAEKIVIDGKPAVKFTEPFRAKFEDKNKTRNFVRQSYYFTYRTLNFEIYATSPAEGDPDFKEFTELIQSIKFEE